MIVPHEYCQQGDRISSLDARIGGLEQLVGTLGRDVARANGKLDMLCDGLLAPTGQSIRVRTKWGTVRGPAGWVGVIVLAGLAAYARAKGWL